LNENITLANLFNEIYIALGIYPSEFKTKKDLSKLDYLFDLYNSLNSKIKNKTMIGEIGLDFKGEFNEEVQREAFEQQINFAKDKNLFVQIHSRFAVRQTLETLIKNNTKKVIMHWYTTSRKFTKMAIENDYFVTVGPSYLYNHDSIWEIIKDLNPNKIIFETDYPVTFDNVIQKPSVIRNIAEKYSEDTGVSIEELDKIQEKNFKLLYPL